MHRRFSSFAVCVAVAALAFTSDACAFRGRPDVLALLPDSAYGNQRLARELRPAAEFPLYLADADTSIVAYRMVSLGPWGGASVMRLEQLRGSWRVVVKETDNSTPRRFAADSVNVAREQADSLVAVLAASRYWTQPPQSCRLGLDGYRIVLEARIRTQYYSINCWVPEDSGAPAVVRSMRAFQVLVASAFPAPSVRAP
jgi:hypothetical protein